MLHIQTFLLSKYHKDRRKWMGKYHVHQLVYYELHQSMEEAILREKRLKEWKRSWKLNLIEKSNPHWQDLYQSIL